MTFKGLPTVVGLMILVGCSQSPVERFEACHERVSKGDAPETVSDCFSARSQTLLSALWHQADETDGTLDYLESFDQLLDEEIDPEAEVDMHGSIVFLRTLNGQTVVMVKEDGEWRIDLMELRSFWAPLAEALEAE